MEISAGWLSVFFTAFALRQFWNQLSKAAEPTTTAALSILE
jgi:hypothetical protein